MPCVRLSYTAITSGVNNPEELALRHPERAVLLAQVLHHKLDCNHGAAIAKFGRTSFSRLRSGAHDVMFLRRGRDPDDR